MIDPEQINERRLFCMGRTELRKAVEFYDKPENMKAFKKWQAERNKQKETTPDSCIVRRG